MKLIATILLLAGAAPAAEWKPLFNGKDLTGWEMVGPGRFLVENGMLKTEGGMGLLWYKGAKFGNTTLRVVFKTTGPADNSGVYIRFPEQPKDPWYAVHNGYEVQIDAAGDDWHCTGSIYSLSKAIKRTQKPAGEWNTMEIELRGQETIVRLNGEVVNDFRGDQPVPPRKAWYEPVRGPRAEHGYMGLQNHDARTTVYFKEVSVKQ
jgi:3-keto-disaccharide hydrolase